MESGHFTVHAGVGHLVCHYMPLGPTWIVKTGRRLLDLVPL